MSSSKFILKTDIPEIFYLGFVDYLSYSGIDVSYNQKLYLRSQWNKFLNELGSMPEPVSAGTDFILDTEFTDLKDGKPISIALVNRKDPDTFFYVELNDTYVLSDCSDFVKSDVLPYLENELSACSTIEAQEQIISFLSSYPRPWRIWSDCPRLDNTQLNYLLHPSLYESCSLQNLDYLLATCYVNYSRRADEFNNYNAHNALDDAKRYAITWNKLSFELNQLNMEKSDDCYQTIV